MKLSALAIAILGLCCIASADTLKDQLTAMNGAVEHALLAKDINAFDKVMKPIAAPNFKYIDEGKTSDYKTMLAGMKMGVGQMTKVTVASVKLLSYKTKGNTGRVTAEHKMLGTVVGADKKSHALAYTGLSTEEYELKNGKWLMVSMSMKTVKMTMDGRALPAAGK